MPPFGTFVVLGLLASAVPASAQSLADVARQEAVRRRSAGPTKKIYTNGDLAPAPLPSPVPSPSSAAGSGSGTQAPVAGPPSGTAATEAAQGGAPAGTTPNAAEGPVKDEAYWTKRLQALRDQLDVDGSNAEAMQSRINALTTDFTNRDDPAQRGRIGVQRQKALADMDRLKKSMEAGKKAIADLQEEGRRAGAPAGWLR